MGLNDELAMQEELLSAYQRECMVIVQKSYTMSTCGLPDTV